MASRKIDSSRSKGKYTSPKVRKNTGTPLITNFALPGPVQSRPANLAALAEPEPRKPESVPQYGPAGIRAVNEPISAQDKARQYKHKDILTNEFANPDQPNLLRQEQLPYDLTFEGAPVTAVTLDGPNRFWVTFLRDDEYEKMAEDIDKFYDNFHSKYELLGFEQLKVGSFYVVNAVHPNDFTCTKRWYRCQIKSIVTARDPVTAFLVDSGVCVRVESKDFRRLKLTFISLPIQAYECALQAPEGKSIKSTFEDCKDFNTRVLHGEFTVIVCAFPYATGNMKKLPVYLAEFGPVAPSMLFLNDELSKDLPLKVNGQ